MREGPELSDAFAGFDAALKNTTQLVEKAASSNYQLRHRNYRNIYLRHRRTLLKTFLSLRDALGPTETIVQKIEGFLRPVFKIDTDTEDKKAALDSLGPILPKLKKLVERRTGTDLILLDSKPYEAFKQILARVERAKKHIMIVDAYVDETIFQLYLERVSAKVLIRVLTKNISLKFKQITAKFRRQHRRIEIRSSPQVHDRYLVVDDRVWLIGQSLKDAGNKPLAIVELRDAIGAIKFVQSIWNRAEAA